MAKQKKRLNEQELEKVSGGVNLSILLGGGGSSSDLVKKGNVTYNKKTGNFFVTPPGGNPSVVCKAPLFKGSYLSGSNLATIQGSVVGVDYEHTAADMKNLEAICRKVGIGYDKSYAGF